MGHIVRFIGMLAVMYSGLPVIAQKIVYSDYGKEDTRRINFEIAGKVGENFLIYKNIRNKNLIVILDNNMQKVGEVDQDYIPDNDKMINVDFFPYPGFLYMIYQYQKKNIVYCMASKIDAGGNPVSKPVELDTTHIGFAANNKIYTVLSSEDRNRLMVMKINSKKRDNYIITTQLYDPELSLLKRSRLDMPMEERNDFLTEFNLDNDGNLVFTKFNRTYSDNIGEASLVVKYAMADSFLIHNINLGKIFLDEIRVKVDNFNKRYFITSFFYRQRKVNIDGFYFYVWDLASRKTAQENTLAFTDDIKREARSDANIKLAFNDYFIRNIIIRKDGGFIIGSESFYTTSRFNSWNRWDYMYGVSAFSVIDYYNYNPYYSNPWGYSRFRSNQSVRYHADNIMVFSFNKEGGLEWHSVINKGQYDDESDDLVSYQLMNTGGELHFLFTDLEKRTRLLNDFSLSPEGRITHNPTLKNLDRGYEFMPRFARQVSARQMIIPCLYRNNFICFAKIDYNQ